MATAVRSIISSTRIPLFQQRKYKVIIADSRTQGKSADSGDNLTAYEMMVDDYAAALLDAMKIDSADVIGWATAESTDCCWRSVTPKK